MKNLTAYALPAILGLAVIEVGFDNHATAAPASTTKQVLVSSTVAEDIDLVGVVGDVLVDGCKSGDTRCNKAWKDLGSLAEKNSL
jgi:hypothetical protein